MILSVSESSGLSWVFYEFRDSIAVEIVTCLLGEHEDVFMARHKAIISWGWHTIGFLPDAILPEKPPGIP